MRGLYYKLHSPLHPTATQHPEPKKMDLRPGPLSVTAGLSPSRLLLAAEPQPDKALVEIRVSLERRSVIVEAISV